MNLGYLVPEFPVQTHAFFWREIAAIEEAGTSVRLYSTRRPLESACPHSFASEARDRTTYLFPPRPGAAAELLKKPQLMTRAIAYVRGLKETDPKGKLRLLALLPSAAMLAADARRHGVTHLHIHSCADAAHLGAMAHMVGNLPYSLTLHGDLAVYGNDHPAKMAHARFVAAVTAPLAAQIRNVSPATDAPVIWMGVDCDRFAPRPRDLNQDFTVATVARLNHVKGHRHVLSAIARLRDLGLVVRYKIAGDGPERDGIAAEIGRLGLHDQVELLGALDENVIVSLLNHVDALVLASFGKGEAAPVAVMEAMACGVPVVCSAIGGTPDMIQSGIDGILTPQQDVEAIADALRTLAGDGELRQRIGKAARATAMSRFDYRSNARKLVDRIRSSVTEGAR